MSNAFAVMVNLERILDRDRRDGRTRIRAMFGRTGATFAGRSTAGALLDAGDRPVAGRISLPPACAE